MSQPFIPGRQEKCSFDLCCDLDLRLPRLLLLTEAVKKLREAQVFHGLCGRFSTNCWTQDYNLINKPNMENLTHLVQTIFLFNGDCPGFQVWLFYFFTSGQLSSRWTFDKCRQHGGHGSGTGLAAVVKKCGRGGSGSDTGSGLWLWL